MQPANLMPRLMRARYKEIQRLTKSYIPERAKQGLFNTGKGTQRLHTDTRTDFAGPSLAFRMRKLSSQELTFPQPRSFG